MSKTKQTARRQTQIKTLKRLPDAKIATDDIPEVRDCDEAVRGRFYRPVKKAVSLRLDPDVLA